VHKIISNRHPLHKIIWTLFRE